MKKYTTILLTMPVLVGCQTTESAEIGTEPQTELQKIQKEDPLGNPFSGRDIPLNQIIHSTKPVICGRMDTILARMEKKFGEIPILVGKVSAIIPGKGETQVMATLTYNSKTRSYTFLEQMPAENRLMCILSSGHGMINKDLIKGTAL